MVKVKINFETNELNYLFGGYFSGCGKLRIGKKTHGVGSYSLTINICFDDLKIAELFQQSFGGHLYKRKSNVITKQGLKGKSQTTTFKIRKIYRWVSAENSTKDFIYAIEPYIIDKQMKKRFAVAKAYYNYQQKNSGLHSDVVRKQKYKYYLQMRRLK